MLFFPRDDLLILCFCGETITVTEGLKATKYYLHFGN